MIQHQSIQQLKQSIGILDENEDLITSNKKTRKVETFQHFKRSFFTIN